MSELVLFEMNHKFEELKDVLVHLYIGEVVPPGTIDMEEFGAQGFEFVAAFLCDFF